MFQVLRRMSLGADVGEREEDGGAKQNKKNGKRKMATPFYKAYMRMYVCTYVKLCMSVVMHNEIKL